MTAGGEDEPIRSWIEYEGALRRVEALMHISESHPEFNGFLALVGRVEAYEAKHFKIDQPGVLARLQFRVEQEGGIKAWMRRREFELTVGGISLLCIVGMGLIIWLIPGVH